MFAGHFILVFPMPLMPNHNSGKLWTASSSMPANSDQGLTLRQAALIAGFAYLLMPVTFAEFYINPKLLIPGNVDQTAQNIVFHPQLHSQHLHSRYAATAVEIFILNLNS